ncbi:MAG: aromatic ring-hydroxylating dioxygenase subunit alpha [Polyangiaceae bacterium]|nr:aromatic ring-hydroxylating dioxygenase subunit alpha [Polyangiaceae bacterium]
MKRPRASARRVHIPTFFDLDRELFNAAWIPIAHESELAAPGQYCALDFFGERIVVVRGADFAVRGFLDRCVHRATPLTEGAGGALRDLCFTCPYHGLKFDLAGRADPRSAPWVGVKEGSHLAPVRVYTFMSFVWFCLSPTTPDLPAWMGAPPQWLLRASLHALRLGRRRVFEAAANWKLLVQNFQESHHFSTVHPSLEARTTWRRSTSSVVGDKWFGGTMELAVDAETVSETGKLDGRPPVAHADDLRCVHDALLFPAWLTSLQPDYFLSYRLIPKAIDKTTIMTDIYFHTASRADDMSPSDVYTFWDRTNAEDRAICERQQRGVSQPSFTTGFYAPVEDGQHAFDQRVAAYYLERDGDDV